MECRRPVRRALAIVSFIGFAGVASPVGAQQSDLVGRSAPPAAHISITFENGRLSGTIRNVALRAVLEELGSRTGVTLIPAENMDIGGARVSARLDGIPLDEGIR